MSLQNNKDILLNLIVYLSVEKIDIFCYSNVYIQTCLNYKNIIRSIRPDYITYLNKKLIQKISDNNISIFEMYFMLDMGIDINYMNNEKFSPLIYASYNGNLKIVKMLLKRNAYIDQQNIFETTALMYASMLGHYDIVKILLEKGSDVHIDNKDTYTALLYGIESGNIDIVDLLLKKGADPNTKISFGYTALMCAVIRGYLDIVILLLENGADPKSVILDDDNFDIIKVLSEKI